MNKTVWMVGAGLMAKEYAKVLTALETPYIVIGRGEENCNRIAAEFNCNCIAGGIESFLETKPALPGKVIVAVGIEALSKTAATLIRYGIKDILLEKPGVGYAAETEPLSSLARENHATVLLAYNRRFYASVAKAREIIEADGGVISFLFEFTEWSNVIRGLKKDPAEHNNWFLGNSTHVVDTAFYLGGKPKELTAYVKGGLDWHPASSVFAGAGITEKEALFSYTANWEGPGRWSIEMITRKNRLIFKPMEKLQVQKIDTIAIEPIALDDQLDVDYKPGLYLQTKAFLENNYSEFCSIFEQESLMHIYCQISNYNLKTD